MQINLVVATLFLTIFLDFFNLGLIYPIFTSLIFEGNGNFVSFDSSVFSKNVSFAMLISTFPFGQFLGAPIIGQLSDRYGRRLLLVISLMGTVGTLLICAFGVLYAILPIVLFGRFVGGLMAGNMTLAYASLADFSTEENKVKNFALIPLATGMGFALGPYLAGLLSNSQLYSWAGPEIPFYLASALALINLLLVFWKFPETTTLNKELSTAKPYQWGVTNILKAFRHPTWRAPLLILLLMISSNFIFVQFVGPFAIDRFHIDVTQVGYLYANIGIAIAAGHLFLTRRLADIVSPIIALKTSLMLMGVLLLGLIFSNSFLNFHLLTFCMMLACAVAYTNAMAMVSNEAGAEQQGEIMGIAVSIQSFAEFFPAALLGMVAGYTQIIPLLVAAACAGCAYMTISRKKLCKI